MGDSPVRGGVRAAELVPASVVHLHPEETVAQAMLAGWRAQMAARALSPVTVEARLSAVREFSDFVGEYPWQWRPADVEDWSVELRGRGITSSTLRAYQGRVRQFCDYLVDPGYEWGELCWERFGSHPVQVCHEWNTVSHVLEVEARPQVRPLTRAEIEAFFDYADEQVAVRARQGRKGWLAAWRDATLFKVIYAFGLRRREAAMLDLVDFGSNPKAPEFGKYGLVAVRWGKASKGSPPRRRTVLTVMPWAPQVIEEYVRQVREQYGPASGSVMWPTERGGRIGLDHVSRRFAEYRDQVGLPTELHPHCLRHSYVTHLVEDGYDPLFVQQQVGHAWGATTALYTGVSGDFKNKALRSALDRLAAGQNNGRG